MAALLPKGMPPRDDVEAAARQLVEYQKSNALSADGMQLFFRMVARPSAVLARANAIMRAASENDGPVDDALARDDNSESVTIDSAGRLVRRRAGQPDELVS